MGGNGLYLCSLNLANSSNDEIREDLRFGMRFQLILDTLEKERKSGMCLLLVQEVKNCMSKDGSKLLTAAEIISGISSVTKMIPLCCANHDGFETSWKVTFYDPMLFMHLETHNVRDGEPSRNPSKNMGRQNFTSNKFYWIGNACARYGIVNELSGKEFNLINVHCPVTETWRAAYCKKLEEYVKNNCDGVPILCAGDFNTITDLGGQKQLGFLNGFLIDKTPGGITFIGFPGDGNEDGPYESSLDKVFVNQKWQDEFPSVSLSGEFVNITSPDGLRASDHFLMRMALV